ncbi:hypothetical protein P7K49_002038 [Saguinus oedipus]|uniref:Uncharacterized protein n=1 Tax=Saguinus oedipus TaxID=9490 RepID=A0ABQ9WK30_SAGOE|nr:hypothetical protein P7K49_002038 [Saguinus oedipus]
MSCLAPGCAAVQASAPIVKLAQPKASLTTWPLKPALTILGTSQAPAPTMGAHGLWIHSLIVPTLQRRWSGAHPGSAWLQYRPLCDRKTALAGAPSCHWGSSGPWARGQPHNSGSLSQVALALRVPDPAEAQHRMKI